VLHSDPIRRVVVSLRLLQTILQLEKSIGEPLGAVQQTHAATLIDLSSVIQQAYLPLSAGNRVDFVLISHTTPVPQSVAILILLLTTPLRFYSVNQQLISHIYDTIPINLMPLNRASAVTGSNNAATQTSGGLLGRLMRGNLRAHGRYRPSGAAKRISCLFAFCVYCTLIVHSPVRMIIFCDNHRLKLEEKLGSGACGKQSFVSYDSKFWLTAWARVCFSSLRPG
jgi:hypothetical protein